MILDFAETEIFLTIFSTKTLKTVSFQFISVSYSKFRYINIEISELTNN